MAKVTVYKLQHYDGINNESHSSMKKRTAEAIKKLPQCEVDYSTAEEVDESDLDEYGVYDPNKPRANK